MEFDMDMIQNPLTKGMTSKQLKALKDKVKAQFYSGIYATDIIDGKNYYQLHKAERDRQEEE